MPKEEVNLQFEQIIKQLSEISFDTKEIKLEIKQNTIEMVGIKKDIERIDKERDEDKAENEKQINLAHKSIRDREKKFTSELKERDKKTMWFTGILITIVTVVVTIANMFITK